MATRRCSQFVLLVLSVAILYGTQVRAQDAGFVADADPPMSAREQFEARGVTLGFSYKGEVFGDLSGGKRSRRGGAFLGSGQTSLSLDLSKLKLGRGQLFLGAQTLHGHGINDAYLGAVETPSNLEARKYTKLTEAWYGDSRFNDRLKFKIGRQYADVDFDVIENGGDFLNASYGVVPTSPMPTYPAPALGITAWVSPAWWASLGAGVFQGDKLEAPDESGLSFHKGLFTLAEAKFEPFSKTASRYGVYRLGVWQQAHGAWRTDAAEIGAPVRNYGMYAVADYWFRKRSEEDRGPGVFLRWGWAPSDRSEISGYWGGGIAYPGLNRWRPQDTVGLGVTQVTLPAGRRETVFEAFYKLQASKQITIQPDLQWLRHPAGVGPSGLLAGIRLGITL